MLKCLLSFVLYLIFSDVSAQFLSGIWSGKGDYITGQSITTVMKKMAASKNISIRFSENGTVSGTLNTTYDKAAATLGTNNFDQTFILRGNYDPSKKILLLVITQIKNELPDTTATDNVFKKPDSLYYAITLAVSEGKWILKGTADKILNKNYSGEWIGSSRGEGLGMNISDAISLHLLPLRIILENDSLPLPKMPVIASSDTIAVRKKHILQTIVLDTNYIKIDLYDNGEIDGDIATIILDGKTILAHQLLSDKAATLTVTLSKNKTEHLLELFADNLGSIPPNTALLVLTCKNKRYEINLSSDTAENGCVKLIFKIPKR